MIAIACLTYTYIGQGLEAEVEEADKEREQLVASHAAGLEQLLALQADRLQSRQQAFLAELQVCQYFH